MRRTLLTVLSSAANALLVGGTVFAATIADPWSAAERQTIQSLSLASLPALAADPTNRVADDPNAAALGKVLFFDTRLSSNGQVACSTCHDPDKDFQDGRALAKGVGTTDRRAMPIAGTQYSPWLFWDGRKDSQWAQALGPLESPVEHDTDRAHVAHVVVANYAGAYQRVFGPLPDLESVPAHASPNGNAAAKDAWNTIDAPAQDAVNRVFANVGKAIAAYERRIGFANSRFDDYAAALAGGTPTEGILTQDEVAGLRLFLGKGQCVTCHTGPLFTDNYFHNTGVPAAKGLPADRGREAALAKVTADPFNCMGPYSDASPEDCAELRFIATDDPRMLRAFKTPSLRAVSERAPYMHAGQFASLEEVLEHYRRAPSAPSGKSELRRTGLSAREAEQLVAFLRALRSPTVVR